MSDLDLIVTEQCGSTSDVISYVKRRNEIVPIKAHTSFLHNFHGIFSVVKEIILPHGYPESVSEDYLEYQIWDTLQAFCSSIIGAFKTRAVLKGVGVGDSSANALSAAITWILKDGIGMFGRILFAWWKGSGLDCDCKKWRFFADILNDSAMFIELCLPFYSSVSMQVLCMTSTMYAIVGIAGGATRASITHHQAIRDNMAEISAKDGSQETVVNLIGSFGSIFLLNYFTSSRSEWLLILSLMVLHLYTNFLAVKALVFKTFNTERLALVLKTYFTIGTVLNPIKVNANESVLVGKGLKVKKICGFDIILGQSLKHPIKHYSVADFKLVQSIYESKNYMLFVNGNDRKIYVCLEKGETPTDVVSAYFHAVCLGIATSIYNAFEMDIYSKRQLHHPTPITRLYTYMKSYERNSNDFRNIPLNYLSDFNDFVKQELSMFFTALNVNGQDNNPDENELERVPLRNTLQGNQDQELEPPGVGQHYRQATNRRALLRRDALDRRHNHPDPWERFARAYDHVTTEPPVPSPRKHRRARSLDNRTLRDNIGDQGPKNYFCTKNHQNRREARKLKCLVLMLFVSYSTGNSEESTDYYKLLNVPRDATVQEIRKAFKVLAVKLHPDKNQEDPQAEQKFIQIAKAYEVLKDPSSRREYDLHGDSEFKGKKQNYHSYSYYKDHFGIYDDDPIIVTLSKNDYELNILDINQAWFVNFYSPHCHHCHEMAPIWRKLASELEGVVRVAAVNCEEDYPLCYQLSIDAYPTLLFYKKEAHLYDGEKYRGPKTLEALQEYVLSKVHVNIKEIGLTAWKALKNQQWILFLCCEDNYNCPEKDTMKKIAATMEGLLQVGIVKDNELCKDISDNYKNHPLVFWQIDDKKIPQVHVIEGSDYKEIVDKILNILPHPPVLDENKFHDLRMKLRVGFDKPWLICFYLGAATDLKLELKRLPTMIPNINIGLIHCGKSAGLCAALHIARYPTWCVIKQGGAFEVHQGRDVLHEVAAFARDSSKSTNFHALSPADFNALRREGSAWYIDWYAPWCPPCKRLTPELRKASQHFEAETIQFGTVDCTLHRELCTSQSITSYPTMMLYNGTNIQRFQGTPVEAAIVEFIQDAINPIVINLDEDNFSLLARKSAKEMWVVDFYAPWCGPCQQLAPQYRKLAKSLSQFNDIFVAQVDCVANSGLCDAQSIRGYPTIRLYPLGSKGMGSVAIYNGQRDAIALKRWVVSFLPTKVEALNEIQFKEQILTKKYYLPWLVDFYAPWCGHCVHFEPEFRDVAQRLDGKVRAAKIDCEAHRVFCGHQRVIGYPTIRLYLAPDEHITIDTQDPNEIVRKVKVIVKEYNERNTHDEL